MAASSETKSFEAKVSELIAATRSLSVPQILVVRRLTLRDPESRRWASERQLNVIFNVVLGKVLGDLSRAKLAQARKKNFLPLLPPDDGCRDEDLAVLTEVAAQLGDGPINEEAEAAQASFESLLAKRLLAVPQAKPTIRPRPPIKEPPPLFAAQLAQRDRDRLGSAAPPRASLNLLAEEGAAEEKPFTDFDTLFDDSICAYTRRVIELFEVTGPSRGIRMPFMLAPEFREIYEEVLRRFVLPSMRSSRHVQTLSTSYNWAEAGSDKLIEIMQAGEVNNPILHNWDVRWNVMRTLKVGGKPVRPKPADNPWPMFREDATRYNYRPPEEEHLPFLQDIIRFEIDAIDKCWREISQLYQQEFNPTARQDQLREGALRDGIMKWVSRLPDYVGEMLAIKAHYAFPLCDADFLRRLLNNFGRSDGDRRRNAPFLSDFVLYLV